MRGGLIDGGVRLVNHNLVVGSVIGVGGSYGFSLIGYSVVVPYSWKYRVVYLYNSGIKDTVFYTGKFLVN